MEYRFSASQFVTEFSKYFRKYSESQNILLRNSVASGLSWLFCDVSEFWLVLFLGIVSLIFKRYSWYNICGVCCQIHSQIYCKIILWCVRVVTYFRSWKTLSAICCTLAVHTHTHTVNILLQYTHTHTHTHTHTQCASIHTPASWLLRISSCGVATIRRLLKSIDLFCRISSLL